jgi:DMSO/TMAO reductase YedYZ molybdopterin-dependent catalytic subunit
MKRAYWRRAHCGIVWLVASILVAGCSVVTVPTPQPDVTLVVSGNVATGGAWDADRLRGLGLVELVAIQPNGEELIWQGVLLRDLLDAAQPAPGTSQVIFTNSDGDRVEMSLHDAQACEECLVAFGLWGRDLHLAMPGQPAELWVKRLVSIEMQ